MNLKARARSAPIRWSAALGLIAALLLLLYALYVLMPAPSAAAGEGRSHSDATPQTYLALGDSLAFGYSQSRFEANYPGESPEAFETGYVNDFGAFLERLRPNVQIVNDGCPGETTDSLIEGPCLYGEAYPLHHPYSGGPTSSQLSDALSYIASNPGRVKTITIDIGANDALHVIEGTCKLEASCILSEAPSLFEHVGSNVGYILRSLRQADPHASIIVLGLYNPFGSAIAGGTQLTAALNEVLASVSSSVDARFADPLPSFNPPGAAEQPTLCLLTNMCTEKPDIHPTDAGYRVLAGLMIHQYLLGLRGHSGFHRDGLQSRWHRHSRR